MVNVELVYSATNQCLIQMHLVFEKAVTIAQALKQSGIYDTHPEIKELKVGIFSKPAELSDYLKNGDRLEIYRGLSLDPMEKRRQKAKLAKKLQLQSQELAVRERKLGK